VCITAANGDATIPCGPVCGMVYMHDYAHIQTIPKSRYTVLMIMTRTSP
jgi:hypothetical protein